VRFIGLDVHLDFCEIAICEAGHVRSGGRVPTSPQGLAILAHSLGPDDHVALEATGNALAIARALEPHVARVVVATRTELRAITEAKVKTDRRDARTLARLLAAGLLHGCWLPDEQTRALRRRLARRAQLVRQRTRCKNEVHAVLLRTLKGRPPMSDAFGRGGRVWLAALELPEDERETVDGCLRQIDFLDGEIAILERAIAKHALGSDAVKRLMTVPGVSLMTATTFIAAVGDIRRFHEPSKLVSYLGLDPKSASRASAPRVTAGSPSRAPLRSVRCSARPRSSRSAPLAPCARSTSVSARAAAARSPSSLSPASSPCCSGTSSRASRTTPSSDRP
jgi:transposase